MTISVLRLVLVLNIFWAINLGLRVGVVGTGEVLAFLFASITLNWIVSHYDEVFEMLQAQVSWKFFVPLLLLVSYVLYKR